MANFPTIDYSETFNPNYQRGSLPRSCKAMVSLLKNLGIDESMICPSSDIEELENSIFSSIAGYTPEADAGGIELERIFHSIQVWGGQSGRGVYVRGNFTDNRIQILEEYRKLVEICLSVEYSGENYSQVCDCIAAGLRAFCQNVKGMGISFATKHTRFWLSKTMGKENALPIYDSLMARGVMHCSPSFNTLPEYWEAMKNKADIEGMEIFDLERRLFRLFQQS